MSGRALTLAGMVLALTGGVLPAKPPQIDAIFPAGGQRGSEFDVTASGTIDPWPLEAVCDEAGLSFTPNEKEKGVYRVRIGPEVEPGACLVRFVNPEGATAPRQFVIGTLRERTQSGSDPMVVALPDLPFLVNGKLESGGEVDRFAVEMQAGEVLVAELCSYSLDAPLDPLLHVRGPRGEQLAFNHDATPLGLDPRLVFKAPATARYELQLSAFAYPPQANIRFAGGASSVYRLRLDCAVPSTDLPLPRESGSEEAQSLALPATINGTIDPAGDVDRYRFSAVKGDVLHLEVAAAALGAWVDPVLVLRDAAGKELTRQDDIDRNTQPDVAFDWTAPADGEFTAELRDLNGEGGSRLVYQFRIAKPEPSLAVSAPGGVYAITAGKTLEIAVTVTRRYGFEGALEAGMEGLPPGVTAATVEVSEKGQAKLVLEAVADAAPANGPVTLWAGPKGDPSKRVPCRFELKGANAEAGDLLINHTRRGWLTVIGTR